MLCATEPLNSRESIAWLLIHTLLSFSPVRLVVRRIRWRSLDGVRHLEDPMGVLWVLVRWLLGVENENFRVNGVENVYYGGTLRLGARCV